MLTGPGLSSDALSLSRLHFDNRMNALSPSFAEICGVISIEIPEKNCRQRLAFAKCVIDRGDRRGVGLSLKILRAVLENRLIVVEDSGVEGLK